MLSYRHAPILFISGFGGFVFWLNTVTYISDLSDNCMRVTPDLLSLTYVITNVFIRTAYMYCIAVLCTLLGEYFSLVLCGVEATVRGNLGMRPNTNSGQDGEGNEGSFEQWFSHLFERVWLKGTTSSSRRTQNKENIPEVIEFDD